MTQASPDGIPQTPASPQAPSDPPPISNQWASPAPDATQVPSAPPLVATQVPSGPIQPAPPARRSGATTPILVILGIAVVASLIMSIWALRASTAPATPSGNSIEQTTINAIQAVSPSVVEIQARRGPAGGVGSGEILTTSGYIVTNDHVVHGFTQFTVVLANGDQTSARLVGEAPSQDLAVLQIAAINLKPITVGDSSKVQVGEYAIAFGSPLGLQQSATSGIISALDREVNEEVDGQIVPISGLIQTSAPINPGNSGGALINLNGELVGIPTLGVIVPSTGAAASGIGFAIASNTMKSIVSQLTNGAA